MTDTTQNTTAATEPNPDTPDGVSDAVPHPAGAAEASASRESASGESASRESACEALGFVHLSVHSEYSLADSIVRLPQLVKAAATRTLPAVAVCDQNNFYAAVKFHNAAVKTGVKPIHGADVMVEDTPGAPPNRLRLLCENESGYRNLMRLISRTYNEGQVRGEPVAQPAWVFEATEGLIALSGGADGAVARAVLAGNGDAARALTARYRDAFRGDFVLELERLGRPFDHGLVANLVDLAALEDVPVVATNAVRFIDEEDFQVHEVRVCVQQGRTIDDPRRPKDYTPQQYLKSSAQMRELFADIPHACDNSVAIATRCTLEIDQGKNYLPEYPIPEGHTIQSFLEHESRQGLARRFETRGKFADEAVYEERLAFELKIIIDMDFPGYFLIVADFIDWAKNNGVPVGPGRGSGAGSLVAYVLGITDVDPLAYDLLFERFLNPERVSMPDFDIDFCMDGRDRVIEYVADKYGREKVSQIVTFGRMAAKAVVRDVGRVLSQPYGFVDGLAKLVPMTVGVTLQDAIDEVPELAQRKETEEDVGYLLDMALKLEGIARNTGKHAGGVVIAPSRIDDFAALQCELGGGGATTQLDWRDTESVGLVKFDFLGLKTLTVIDWALAEVRKLGADVDIETLPLDDAKTFALLQSAKTAAVFQLESSGMRKLIADLKPDRFEDIVALVALFRPGPLETGMAKDYVERKNGRQEVEFLHELMRPPLADTFGVIVYQEQVMAVAREMAGYSLGNADQLRRAMGKKDAAKMAVHRPMFVQGSVERGVDEDLAGRIFDLIAEFAKYGFNKSHSVAYALVAYQTAYLKAHHPAAFMCAVLSADMDHTEKVVPFIDECRNLGLAVHGPDVNASEYKFSVEDAETIRYGLGAIKGVGEGAIEGALEARRAGGRFKDLGDFCARIDLKRCNRRTLESLINAGAMDSLGQNRPSLLATLPKALAAADQLRAAEAAGQNDLFGGGMGVADTPDTQAMFDLVNQPDWDDLERLAHEKSTLGLYLTGHPIDAYREQLVGLTDGTIAEAKDRASTASRRDAPTLRIAGLVVDLMLIRAKNRAVIKLDDGTAQIECTLFKDGLEKFEHLLRTDALLIIEGKMNFDSYANDVRMKPNNLLEIDDAFGAYAKRLIIDWQPPADDTAPPLASRLRGLLEPLRIPASQTRDAEGSLRGAGVLIKYRNHAARAQLELGWRVNVSQRLLRDLEASCGGVAVRWRRARAGDAAAQSSAASDDAYGASLGQAQQYGHGYDTGHDAGYDVPVNADEGAAYEGAGYEHAPDSSTVAA